MFNLINILPVNVRIIFALSMLSNLPAATTGDATTITNYAKPKIEQALASAPAVDSVSLKGWQLVWGPAVIAKPGSKAVDKLPVSSNSMSIFKDQGNNYVIGIEATNPYSDYDWIVEDANIKTSVKWSDISKGTKAPATARISKGTFIGLSTLLDSLKDNSTQLSALQYLQKNAVPQGKINITVTGHSLAGALSPAFALYLADNYSQWGGSSNVSIYCVSTAGPTPGNKAFANYYNSLLQNYTQRIWNDLDVVPRAWVKPLLTEVASGLGRKGLYSATGASIPGDSVYCPTFKQPCVPLQPFKPITTPLSVNTLIATAKGWIDLSLQNYTHVCGNGTSFHGAPNGPYINIQSTSATKDIYLFLDEMGQQHVTTYNMQFNIWPIHEYVSGLVKADPNSIINRDFKSLKASQSTSPTDIPGLLGQVYQRAWGW